MEAKKDDLIIRSVNYDGSQHYELYVVDSETAYGNYFGTQLTKASIRGRVALDHADRQTAINKDSIVFVKTPTGGVADFNHQCYKLLDAASHMADQYHWKLDEFDAMMLTEAESFFRGLE